MSVRLRLQRHGSKKRPFYRLVAADQRMPRDGRYKEQLGTINPMHEPNIVDVDLERVDYWLGVGAQPTETASALIRKAREGGHFISMAQFVADNKAARRARQSAAANAQDIPEAVSVPTPAAPVAEAAAEDAPAAEVVADAPAVEEADAAAEQPAADDADEQA